LPYFRVAEVYVEGNLQVATEEIVASLGLPPDTSLLDVDLPTLSRRVLQNPWIKEASVRRRLPLALTIQVVERVPEAVFIADRRYLLSADGVILTDLDGDDLPTLPTLRAATPRRVRPGDRVLSSEMAQGLAVWRQFQLANAVQGERAHEIAMGGDGSYTVNLGQQMPFIRLHAQDMQEQLRRLGAALAASGRTLGTFAAVDLRFRDRVASGLTGEASLRLGRSLVVGLTSVLPVCAIVVEVDADGAVDIIGIGHSPSRGLRKGVVVNIDATVDSVRRAVEDAELMAGVEIRSAFVGIAGGHIKGINSRGVIAISGKNHEVTRQDIDRVIDAAKAVALPVDREVIHILPQEFIIDDQTGIKEPLGMTGTRLEAEVHIVTGAVASAQNIIKCANKAGLEVQDIVLQQLASSEACLTPEEKELGCILVDIGGGTTDTPCSWRRSPRQKAGGDVN
jgi:cell division septal protein FtsQ/Ethanolamine utilization protein EutJ (predicted chaperonin)